MEIFIANEASRRYSNMRLFDSSALTQARHFENRALVIEMVKYTIQLFREMYTKDVAAVQWSTHVADSSICIEHIINPA
jgi:hypothetical protein